MQKKIYLTKKDFLQTMQLKQTHNQLRYATDIPSALIFIDIILEKIGGIFENQISFLQKQIYFLFQQKIISCSTNSWHLFFKHEFLIEKKQTTFSLFKAHCFLHIHCSSQSNERIWTMLFWRETVDLCKKELDFLFWIF